MVSISIIVPFYNSEKYIKGCADSLVAQKYPANDYEIIFVDNNSTDSSAGIVERYPEIKLVSESKQSSYAARNRGIKESSGRIIAFTDPDCIASPDWLAEIENAMSDPVVSIILGRPLMANDSLLLSMLEDYENEKNAYILNSNDRNRYFGHTNNMAVRRELFDELGLFIERERGGDTVFVNSAVKKYSSQAVKYSESVKVRHLEIETPLDYYKKAFTHGRHRELSKDIRIILPISYKKRLSIYRRVTKKRRYSYRKSLALFILLIAGMIFWEAGGLSAWIHRD
ncbi:MAG: glycosyltransferase [Deltaproteobacteria bacterium]